LRSPFTEKNYGDLATGDIEGDGDIDIALATVGEVAIILNNSRAATLRNLSRAMDTYEDTVIAIEYGRVSGCGRD